MISIINKNKRRSKRLKRLIITIYTLEIIFLFVITTEVWIPKDKCAFYYKYYYYKLYLPLLSVFVIGVSSYLFHKLIKGDLTLGLVILLPTLSLLIKHHSSRYLTDYRINNNLSIIRKGVITEKSQQAIGSTVVIKYKDTKRESQRGFSVINYDVTKLSINDTILFIYVEKCKYIGKIYKYKPTKSELEKCKNDCYLIHGKLIPVDEYKKSKTKELY